MNERPARNSVTVRIAGDEHVLRSSAEPEYTRRCANFLDERIRDVRRHSGLSETHRAVILAALSITDRYFQAQDELDRLRKEVVSRSTNLVRRVEAELEAPSRST
jgi:cell division protein ZapA (FtsZ GTPase activity inhibitor)